MSASSYTGSSQPMRPGTTNASRCTCPASMSWISPCRTSSRCLSSIVMAWMSFIPKNKDLENAVQRTEEYVRTQLGDARSFSLDSPKSRIPRIEAINDSAQDALIVQVHTDDPNIVGYGEVDSSPEVVKAIIDAPASHSIASGLRALLIGEDPSDIGRLWQRMFRGSLYYGRRGAAIHAISGVDIALWDLLGKATGKSVATLLGGRRRERVRAYASALMPDGTDEVRSVPSVLGRDRPKSR